MKRKLETPSTTDNSDTEEFFTDFQSDLGSDSEDPGETTLVKQTGSGLSKKKERKRKINWLTLF